MRVGKAIEQLKSGSLEEWFLPRVWQSLRRDKTHQGDGRSPLLDPERVQFFVGVLRDYELLEPIDSEAGAAGKRTFLVPALLKRCPVQSLIQLWPQPGSPDFGSTPLVRLGLRFTFTSR
jgi:hypothetical protein